MENGFKETEIGDIPEAWNVVKLSEVAETQSGGTPSRKKPDYFNGSIPWVKSGELEDSVIYHTEESITQEGLANSSAKIFPVGTLLIALYGATVGKTAILGINASTNQAVCAIFPKDNIFLSEFLRLYLIFARDKLLDARYGGAQPNISQTIIKNIKFPLPPLPEQQKIAKVLSTIQQAIEQQDKIIASVRELKKSLMRKLFTEGLGDAELKETEIGTMPKHWDVVSLGEVCEQRREIVQPTGCGQKYVGLEHIDSGEAKLNRHGSDDEVRSSKNKFYPSDVLYGKLRPYLDKAVLAEFEGICSTDIIVLKANQEKIIPQVLVNIIHLPSFLSFAISRTSGTNHPRTSWRALESFKVSLPSPVEQKEIARILSAVDTKIAVEENRKRLLQELFKTMLHKLMTGQIRVKDLDLEVCSESTQRKA